MKVHVGRTEQAAEADVYLLLVVMPPFLRVPLKREEESKRHEGAESLFLINIKYYFRKSRIFPGV